MSRTLPHLAALVMLVVIAAGCGSGSSRTGNRVATSGGGVSRSGGNSPATSREQPFEMALKFARCMREHGVSGFPDPTASGEMTLDGVANGSSVDTNSAAFERALSACKDLEPRGFTGPKVVTPQQMAARLEFARCMRENGVPDFPDPAPNEPLVDTNRIPSAATTSGMSALNAAMHKCGAIYSRELGVRGT